jgi:hypothetical protein
MENQLTRPGAADVEAREDETRMRLNYFVAWR